MQDNLSLGAKITVDDVKKTINSLKNGKACGPDGFPAEVYKTFVDILAPLLTRMFQYAYDEKKLPKTMQQSIISLIPKDHKDPENPASYRPLSIQNTDSKILACVLAMRLNNVIHKLVSSDQTGFIKMRQSSANVRRLLGILQYVAYKKEKAVVIALDAEKAFDRVEWKYLFRVLKEFSFNESFINWIKLLYTNP